MRSLQIHISARSLNLYLSVSLNKNQPRMKRPIFVCMVMLSQASQNFQASQNLKNCPEDYPFAVSGGKRCMNIFEVHSNSSEYLYRIGRKFQQCLFLYFWASIKVDTSHENLVFIFLTKRTTTPIIKEKSVTAMRLIVLITDYRPTLNR